jgi:hypothetical protein
VNKKEAKKTLIPLVCGCETPANQFSKRFLILFFKNEVLASYC